MNDVFTQIMFIIGFLYVFRMVFAILKAFVIDPIRAIHANEKAFKEISKNRCKVHSWISTENSAFTQYGAMLCKDCGIVSGADPEVFILKTEVDNMVLIKKNLELLMKYKDKQKQALSDKHNLVESVIDDIYEAGVNVKKEFHLKQIDEYLQKAKK